MFKFLRNKKIILAVVILAVLAILLFQYFTAGSEKKVNSYKVVPGNLKESLTISGSIDADEHVTLRFQTAGRLTWIGVKEGDYVKKYQGIASLDQVALQKTLQKNLSDYLSARWDLDQSRKDTYRDQVITDTIKRVIDKYQFTMNKSVLDVEIQTLAIDLANLWTPIEGIVTRVSAPYAGVNTSAATQAEFDIVNPNTVYFSATADQADVVKLRENMPGDLTLDSYTDATLAGVISKISLIPDPTQTGTAYRVKFYFPNSNGDYKYRLGMTGDVNFTTKRKEDVLYAPSKFIKTQDGSKYVVIKKNGKDTKVQISTGMETDKDTEITSGISAGETIYD